MNPIGGYFELECGHSPQYHKNGYLLNSCRSALRLAIRTYSIKKMYLPFYTCPVVWEAVKKEDCECIGYEIGMDFMPTTDLPTDAFILYTNYFGICATQVKKMAQRYPNLIVDNAQAFYMPMHGIASIYSPRKFFGVPDGGILLSKKEPIMPEERSVSWQRCSHLLKRWDLGAEASYQDFQKDDDSLNDEGILLMSYLTQAMLGNCDYASAKQRRLANFQYLHARLKATNQLNIQLTDEDVPLVYPFLCHDTSLRHKLIEQKIFVAKYWPGANCEKFDNLLALPIDQRYNVTDMERPLKVIFDNEYDVYLRPLCMNDAKISYKWRNNPEIWKNTGSAPNRVITEDMETEWMRKVLADSTSRRFAICLKSNDRYIGNIYLTDITDSSAEEQIFIGETELWGKGIATKARAALYEIAQKDLGLMRVVSNIRVRNLASLKSVLKLGFTEVSRDTEWIKLELVLGGRKG